MDETLILASGSPRRRDLMEEAGYRFEVVKPDVEEIEDATIPIRELTRLNAKLKADAVAGSHPGRVVIAADTLVLLDGIALGKPADAAEAFAMIRSLNGRTHQVYTAVCVARAGTEADAEFFVVTDVTFRRLSDAELRRYHELIDPMDKAGAYAAQDHGDIVIERVTGSWTNVVGLPMEELAKWLGERFGVLPGGTRSQETAGGNSTFA
ncbi:MAG: septum formation protein Maf [Verrucomicrobiae bacterium]|nr:septum formation protein Maf [Verrucomicrobiae bacterium]MCP5539258.1 septum formation protein Maf [Akkermansiaceae bacterium]